ncbi:MAG: metal-dependent transcriptional regulator [Anaerohalosphaeraceae bacterium]|nr:metal-dependent transcriptional regulator [Anaerohalosphaeraceae bacterium]
MAIKTKTKLTASLEDYLEAIFNLIGPGGFKVARSKDIAEVLEVSQASVTGALRTLAEKKLVNYKPYGFITMTPKGAVEAEKVAKRHEILESFFTDILGIDPNIAQQAACKAEHVLGQAVIVRLLELMDFLRDYEKDGRSLTDEFRAFYEIKG